jgi:hypothetical protein
MPDPVPMDQDDVPPGDVQQAQPRTGARNTSGVSSETPTTNRPRPSVRDIVDSAKAEDKWEVLPLRNTVIVSHREYCEECTSYAVHLDSAAKGGEVNLRHRHIVRALDKAWASSMEDVRKDAREQVEQAYDKLAGQLTELRRAHDHEREAHEALKEKCHAMEEKLALYEGKGKQKATEIPSSTTAAVTRWPEPPPEDDPLVEDDLFNDGSDSDDPSPNREVIDVDVSTSTRPSTSSGPVRRGRRSAATRAAAAPYPSRTARPVASLPMAYTGVLPTPLGRTQAESTYSRPRAWFDTCDVELPEFQAALQQAHECHKDARTLIDHVVLNRMKKHKRQVGRVPAFPEEPGLPADMQEWTRNWSKNPQGTPRPIRDDALGRLSITDLDIWLWCRSITPREHGGEFQTLLWNIFLVPGRWHAMAGHHTGLPRTNTLRGDVDGRFAWTGPLSETTEGEVAGWCATHGGVTSDRARELLEPYAARRATGEYYNAAGKKAHAEARATAARRAAKRGDPSSTTTPAVGPFARREVSLLEVDSFIHTSMVGTSSGHVSTTPAMEPPLAPPVGLSARPGVGLVEPGHSHHPYPGGAPMGRASTAPIMETPLAPTVGLSARPDADLRGAGSSHDHEMGEASSGHASTTPATETPLAPVPPTREDPSLAAKMDVDVPVTAHVVDNGNGGEHSPHL